MDSLRSEILAGAKTKLTLRYRKKRVYSTHYNPGILVLTIIICKTKTSRQASAVMRHRRVGAISSLLMVSLFVLFLNTAKAGITTSYGSPYCGICTLSVVIQGEINNSDLEVLKKAIAEAPKECVSVRISAKLDSSGGDIEAAMGIGHLFRKHEATVFALNRDSSCQSACIFLLAGAVNRLMICEDCLGIHRPYFANSQNWTERDMEMRYKNMIEQIRVYFRKMNIPEALADAMISVPPGQMEVLPLNKALQFMLMQRDPAHEELEISRNARVFGLTSLEWRKRDQTATKMCFEKALTRAAHDSSTFYDECYDEYTLNFSPEQSRYFREQRGRCAKSEISLERCLQCFGRAYRDAIRVVK